MTATYFVQDHVIFASRLMPWFAWQPRKPAQKTTHAEMQKLYPLLSQYLRHRGAAAIKNALFRAIKISEFGIVERHNGDHVIHVTSDDVTGDGKVAHKIDTIKCIILPLNHLKVYKVCVDD